MRCIALQCSALHQIPFHTISYHSIPCHAMPYHGHLHAHPGTQIDTCTHTHIRSQTHTRTHTYIYIYTTTYPHIPTHTLTRTHTHTYTHIYTHTHACTRRHTPTHPQTHTQILRTVPWFVEFASSKACSCTPKGANGKSYTEAWRFADLGRAISWCRKGARHRNVLVSRRACGCFPPVLPGEGFICGCILCHDAKSILNATDVTRTVECIQFDRLLSQHMASNSRACPLSTCCKDASCRSPLLHCFLGKAGPKWLFHGAHWRVWASSPKHWQELGGFLRGKLIACLCQDRCLDNCCRE